MQGKDTGFQLGGPDIMLLSFIVVILHIFVLFYNVISNLE